MSKFIKLTAAMAVAAFTMQASALDLSNGWYIGAGPEVVKVSNWCDGKCVKEEFELGIGLNGGYDFNDYAGVEAGGLFVSGFDKNGITDTDFETKFKTISLGGKLGYPVTDKLVVDTSVGYHYWSVGNDSLGNRYDPYYGVGMSYKWEGDFEGDFDVEAGYAYYDLHNVDSAQSFNFGLTYNF